MRILALPVLALLAACAAQPPAEAPPAAPALAASSIPADAPAPSAAPAAAAEEADEFKPPAGYKRKVVDGRIYYCTQVVVLGSRFPKDDCRTQTQLIEMEAQRASVRGEMEQKRAVCGSSGACGSF